MREEVPSAAVAPPPHLHTTQYVTRPNILPFPSSLLSSTFPPSASYLYLPPFLLPFPSHIFPCSFLTSFLLPAYFCTIASSFLVSFFFAPSLLFLLSLILFIFLLSSFIPIPSFLPFCSPTIALRLPLECITESRPVDSVLEEHCFIGLRILP